MSLPGSLALALRPSLRPSLTLHLNLALLARPARRGGLSGRSWGKVPGGGPLYGDGPWPVPDARARRAAVSVGRAHVLHARAEARNTLEHATGDAGTSCSGATWTTWTSSAPGPARPLTPYHSGVRRARERARRPAARAGGGGSPCRFQGTAGVPRRAASPAAGAVASPAGAHPRVLPSRPSHPARRARRHLPAAASTQASSCRGRGRLVLVPPTASHTAAIAAPWSPCAHRDGVSRPPEIPSNRCACDPMVRGGPYCFSWIFLF